MKANLRYTLLSILGLGGVIVSGVLSRHYYALRSGLEGFKSYCNVSETFNCDAVASSRYAELLPGLPLSSFAGGWFLAIAIVALFGRDPFWKRDTDRALLALTAFGAAMSTIYLGIMIFVLKTYCINCLITDALSFTCFAVALSLKPSLAFKDPKQRADRGKWKTFAGITAGTLIVSLVGMKTMDPLALDSRKSADLVSGVLQTAPDALSAGTQHIHAPAGAKTVIQEFLDFQCPSCRIGAQTMTRLIERYGDTVQVTLRNFPLDPACNSGVPAGRGHPAACEAARAGICAGLQGKLKEAYYAFFENQESFVPGKPTALARAIPGMDEGQLLACMDSAETRAILTADLEEGKRLGVQSTPTFFVNGRKLRGSYPLPVWIKIIDSLR